jgi:hypothetical protein
VEGKKNERLTHYISNSTGTNNSVAFTELSYGYGYTVPIPAGPAALHDGLASSVETASCRIVNM